MWAHASSTFLAVSDNSSLGPRINNFSVHPLHALWPSQSSRLSQCRNKQLANCRFRPHGLLFLSRLFIPYPTASLEPPPLSFSPVLYVALVKDACLSAVLCSVLRSENVLDALHLQLDCAQCLFPSTSSLESECCVADLLVSRIGLSGFASESTDGAAHGIRGTCGCSVAARGLMWANEHPAPKRWLPLKASQLNLVTKAVQANLLHLQTPTGSHHRYALQRKHS